MSVNTGIDIITDQLIKRVIDVYPARRVDQIKQRFHDVWNGRPAKDRIPYVCGAVNGTRNMPRLSGNESELERSLVYQLQGIINHSEWNDDFFPALSPGLRQITIPSYFGCIEEVASTSTRIKPVITNPPDVYGLTELGFIPGTVGHDILEKMRYFRKRTKGCLPVFETDMQGPFSIASQIWGIERFLTAIYECPDEVNYLLQRCTEVIIEYFKLMLDAVDQDLVPMHCFPLIWFPKEKGVAVSEDLVAVVSPATFRNFIRPYLERIADEFGGVVMHSCGSINHVIHELNQVRGLVGINCSSTETDIERLAQDMNPDYILIAHNSPVSRPDIPLYDEIQHIELCRKVFSRRNGICVINSFKKNPDPAKDAERLKRAASY